MRLSHAFEFFAQTLLRGNRAWRARLELRGRDVLLLPALVGKGKQHPAGAGRVQRPHRADWHRIAHGMRAINGIHISNDLSDPIQHAQVYRFPRPHREFLEKRPHGVREIPNRPDGACEPEYRWPKAIPSGLQIEIAGGYQGP